MKTYSTSAFIPDEEFVQYIRILPAADVIEGFEELVDTIKV